jgi:hypothetical protein
MYHEFDWKKFFQGANEKKKKKKNVSKCQIVNWVWIFAKKSEWENMNLGKEMEEKKLKGENATLDGRGF